MPAPLRPTLPRAPVRASLARMTMLTPEQSALQATARAYATTHIAPIASAAARARPADPWATVRPAFEAGAALGLTKLFLPPEQGGIGASALDACIVFEEIGAADVGVASDYFSLTATMPLLASRAGGESAAALTAAFAAAPAMVLAGAQSEPNVAGSELMMAGADPAYGPKLSARRDDRGGWVLNGAKSAFVTNAGAAEHFLIIARTDASVPAFQGLSLFNVPRTTPGLSFGNPTALIGWPLSTHAPVHFDTVRLPAHALMGGEGGAAMLFAMVPEMPVCLAACFVGLARAASDYARAYAAERQSTGRPIAQHQAVALKLAEMAVEVHAARLLVHDAAAMCATDPMAAAMFHAPAAKVRAVDAAIRCASLCIEVLGGYGVAREYEAGRFLNDAWIGWSCDFTRDVLMLGIAGGLAA